MRKPEQRLWDSMRAALGKKLLLQRIENLAGVGMPDLVTLGSRPTGQGARRIGTTTFVELKAQESPPVRESTPVLGAKKGLSTEQRNWHIAWSARGGFGLVLIGVGAGATRKIFALRSEHADTINSMTLSELRLYSIANTWTELGVVLGHNE